MIQKIQIRPSLIISLDYELMWGMMDLANAKQYGQTNVLNVQSAIRKMVDLFEKYQVKATFATVGMLMCKDVDELKRFAPSETPTYTKQGLYPYGNYLDKVKKEQQSLYFAPESIELLRQSEMIEIGTHTFCHYYCWEEGQTIDQFEADITAAVETAKQKGIELKSIVFPRNNVNNDYLNVCYRHGITAYRGNALSFFGKKSSKLQFLFRRACRLLDAYIPVAKHTTYGYDMLQPSEGLPLNIPASRMFRPYSKALALLEPLRIARMKHEMKYAAKHGEMYHIWWHPHNFGANMTENLKNLEELLMYFSKCREKYGMQTYTMNELTEIITHEYGK